MVTTMQRVAAIMAEYRAAVDRELDMPDVEDTTATGLQSDGESRQEGWDEYGPDADQIE